MSKSAAAPEQPIRLLRFRIDHSAIMGIGPQFHRIGVVQTDNPPVELDGWTLAIRGAAVLLVSPAGWDAGTSLRRKDGEVTLVGPIPRDSLTCVWRAPDASACDRLARFDCLLTRTSVPVDVAAGIDPKEMGDP